jgi:succinate dehydrogenase / fumarate reductase iron-sulfur subunit
MNPALQQHRYALSRCISCSSCLEVCPQYTPTNSFVGAAIISQALLFNQHPVGAKLKSHRLNVLMQSGGIGSCESSGKCDPACPKGIPNCACIDAIGKQVIEHAMKRMKPGSRRRARPGRRRRRGVAPQN